ncbi:MAG: hypothetical protein AB3A66_16065 [Nodularia sp. CChRGM 3473]
MSKIKSNPGGLTVEKVFGIMVKAIAVFVRKTFGKQATIPLSSAFHLKPKSEALC